MAGQEEKSAQEQQAADQKSALPGTEKPAVEKPEQKPEEKPAESLDPTKVGAEDLLTADLDTLDQLDEHYQKNPEDPAEETPAETDTGEQQKSDEEKAAEQRAVEGEEDPKDKIIADQKAEITKLQQDRAKSAKEEQDAEWKGYEPPNDEDLDLLYDEDREAYDIAVEKQKRYETYLETKAHEQVADAHNENSDAVLSFLADQKGAELNDATRAELIKALKTEGSDEVKLIQELDDYLSANIIPVKRVSVGKDDKGNEQFLPVYSKEQITAAYNLLHFNDIIKSREDKIRTEAAQKIADAASGGSAFDRMESPGPGDVTQKKPNEYTQAEILMMDEDTLKHVDKQYNPEG